MEKMKRHITNLTKKTSVKIILVTVAMILLKTSGLAQDEKVIASTGGSFTSTTSTIDFTIGEVVTHTATGANSIITQGFIQPLISILTEPSVMGVASAITINGDGINDEWLIEGIENYPNNLVQIFNRYGSLLFEVKGYNNRDRVWRGESDQGLLNDSNPVNSGTVFYLINFGLPIKGEPIRKPQAGFIYIKK